ncbi:flavin reductase (DIM6/NTAB) family NADH-FMN oxidoreductase RutF [Arthrobacter ginsengisoli]|uniref:Flavin reductase (DIM6/NTAB) family NADH-FMN oxidoreductase RutF n=1 Tax=Arthrobacter ginsengisoli TaxID=1356565 RepID=A0ABU1UA77_9MICC|nr:hypothetical protein [Arthrobacter ginsengisoli]MDR7082094.1 flavin reductase (DIM6/NTAB) family NADH-FMN oxidoreductase RutF [Arthrobacter ginsengisoli]
MALFFAGNAREEEPEWTRDDNVPVLTRNATLGCRPWNIYGGGDHIIVVGEVIGMEVTKREPILSLGGLFHTIGRGVEDARRNHPVTAAGAGWFAGSGSFRPLHSPAPF